MSMNFEDAITYSAEDSFRNVSISDSRLFDNGNNWRTN